MSFRLVPKSVTLIGVMALILHYFTEFGSFRSTLHKSCWRCHCKKSSDSLSHLLMTFLWTNRYQTAHIWSLCTQCAFIATHIQEINYCTTGDSYSCKLRFWQVHIPQPRVVEGTVSSPFVCLLARHLIKLHVVFDENRGTGRLQTRKTVDYQGYSLHCGLG